jgi:hypothetical protein
MGGFFVVRPVHIDGCAWFASGPLAVMATAFSMLFSYTCFTIKKGDREGQLGKSRLGGRLHHHPLLLYLCAG